MKVINRGHKCFGWAFEFKCRRLALVAILSPPVSAAFTTIAANRNIADGKKQSHLRPKTKQAPLRNHEFNART
jgi:hypothetical protein